MTSDFDPAFDDWIRRAKAVSILDVASKLSIPGLRLQSGEHIGPCPACGGTDRFSINPKKQIFNCRGSGGGDAIEMVRHIESVGFVEACEIINGEPPPRSEKREPRQVNRERERDLRDVDLDQHLLSMAEDDATRRKKAQRAVQIFDAAKDISGTILAEHLKLRGLTLLPEQREFLRFVEKRPYYEHDANGKPFCIGYWPAMVALMRDAEGKGVGLHCTYLDGQTAKKIDVWIPGSDGREYRLTPRKMYGSKGLIWLSKPSAIMAQGEGIETTVSWQEMHTSVQYEDVSIAAAGDLGNLCGGAMQKRPHPRIAGRTIPFGEPDPARPGAPVPPAVREVILLGDADVDEANVRANLLISARRHAQQGRSALIHMAPHADTSDEKWDFNDELLFRLMKKNRRSWK